MKNLNHIRKFLGGSFIVLLLWSITPTHLLHELFATHHDAYLHGERTHEENLSNFTYQCDTKMPVVKTGFVVAEFVSLPIVSVFRFVINDEKPKSAIFSQPRLFKGLRAPPTIS